MYYIIYGFLYAISLLPFFILYRLSDLVYFLLYYVFGYRKKLVMANLSIAFPEKTEEEKKIIAKQFYKSLIDTFIESIKMLSLSGKEFDKRCTVDIAKVNKLTEEGRNIQLHCGHQMNWEFANWVFSKNLTIPFIGIYQVIKNKPLSKVFLKFRGRYNTVLISTTEFKTKVHTLFKEQYSIGLAADQNTSRIGTAYWLYFFSKPVPFVTGPDKGAIKNKTAVVFVNLVKKKRGHYHFETTVVTPDASSYKEGELTIIYRDLLEESIRKQPANYLWTHRRWRHNYEDRFEMWIDTKPKP
jgi:Kdo2-lipid IVA lauroyltransferase/acyltransferase